MCSGHSAHGPSYESFVIENLIDAAGPGFQPHHHCRTTTGDESTSSLVRGGYPDGDRGQTLHGPDRERRLPPCVVPISVGASLRPPRPGRRDHPYADPSAPTVISHPAGRLRDLLK